MLKGSVVTRAGLAEAVAADGLPIEASEGIPVSKPKEAGGQWALLKPYLGRPLRDIPRGLILLFTVEEGRQVAKEAATAIIALPSHHRQVSVGKGGGDVFI